MRVGKRKMICLILAVLVPLSGMYYVNLKADSSVMKVTASGNGSVYIRAADEMAQDIHLCTTEMMEGLDYSDNQQLTPVYIGQKRDARTMLRFLYLNGSSAKRRVFRCSESLLHEQLVSGYIHKLDGKKRI